MLQNVFGAELGLPQGRGVLVRKKSRAKPVEADSSR